jgi:hypothetical protein
VRVPGRCALLPPRQIGLAGREGVSGDVRDGEHFVADRGNQQEIDLREKASHLFGYFPPQAVRLHEVDGVEERAWRKMVTQNSNACWNLPRSEDETP